MQSIERTVGVDRPLAAVWAFLSDFESTNDWDPGTVRTVRTSGDGGPGTVYSNTSRFAGRRTTLDYTVLDREDERLLRLRGVNKGSTVVETMTFAGDAARSSVTYRLELTLRGAARLAAPAMPLVLRKLGDDGERGLREALERL
ncbi:SRPBCC family protein [Solicola sp. PLA-1-18]|uniref:SRPBCC family protein n=1 Tax=Solicola sp. PLA-1-18 TaxID=3380532 RepID=UPI003B7DFE23